MLSLLLLALIGAGKTISMGILLAIGFAIGNLIWLKLNPPVAVPA